MVNNSHQSRLNSWSFISLNNACPELFYHLSVFHTLCAIRKQFQGLLSILPLKYTRASLWLYLFLMHVFLLDSVMGVRNSQAFLRNAGEGLLSSLWGWCHIIRPRPHLFCIIFWWPLWVWYVVLILVRLTLCIYTWATSRAEMVVCWCFIQQGNNQWNKSLK